MARKMLWPVLVIGALLVILPFAFQMPSRTAAGDADDEATSSR